MVDRAKVVVKVIKQEGDCAVGHEVGDEYDLSKPFTLGYEKGCICPSLFYALYPQFRVLMHGGSLSWEEDKDKAHIACPDHINPLWVELKRVAG